MNQQAGAEQAVILLARHPRFGNRSIQAAINPSDTTWLGDLTLLPGGSVMGSLALPGGGGVELRLLPAD
jgi:hypothetical protein